MATFNLRCPKNFPRRCNLLETEKENLERAERYSAFLMYQFAGQDDYLVDVIKRFFQSPTYHVFDAREEVGLGIKICKICRLAQASDFGIVILTPENLNVYLEAGMMMGMGKRNLYVASRNILKEQNKTLKDVAFDLSDQLVIEHEDKKELLRKLEKELPPFTDNVIIGTALEHKRRNYWRTVFNELDPIQKEILKFLSMCAGYYGSESALSLRVLGDVRDRAMFKGHCQDLLKRGIVKMTEITGLISWRIDPVAEPYIHEFLFEFQ